MGDQTWDGQYLEVLRKNNATAYDPMVLTAEDERLILFLDGTVSGNPEAFLAKVMAMPVEPRSDLGLMVAVARLAIRAQKAGA